MSQKDYIILAAALQQSKPGFSDNPPNTDRGRQWAKDVTAIADALARERAQFNREKFYTACGLTGKWA